MSQMKHYLSILFILLLLVACDPAAELGTPFHKGQEVVLTAVIGEQRPQMMPGMQRVSGKDAPTTIDLLWDEGDEILVRVGEASSVFTLIDGAGTANASFMGTMPADGSNYTVSYPVDYSNKLLQQQTYVPDGIAKGLMKMSTASPGTIDDGFTLKAEHAVLGLQLTGNSEIGKLVLTRNAEKGATSVESYTLNCKLSNSKSSGVTLTETATLFYIVLPAGIWPNGFTVDVYVADNTTIIDTFVTNKRFEFTAANATTMAEKDVQNPPKRIGVFSVGAGKKVSFSQGNLQYTQSTDTWRFAAHQYDVIGTDNIQDGALADRIDLFGWSANNTTAPFGVSTSTNAADYAGDFVDWGVNTISGDAPDTWRTLTKEEFDYLMNKRLNAASRLAIAQVNGVNGMILLPDIWQITDEVELKTGLYSTCVADYSVHQSVSEAEWKILENAGAVFLPASGRRSGSKIIDLYQGIYWTSTINNNSPYNIHFQTDKIRFHWEEDTELYARSVRLVHDTIVPETIPAPCLIVKVNDTLSINMMCVEGGTFVMGSDASSNEKPMHQVTIPDFLIGQTEVTQELWQVVMGNNPSHFKGAENPVEYVSWSDCQKFIANLNQLTGKKFRLPTEAEWEYAARGGQMSKDFVFSGSDNVDKVGWYTNNSGAMSHPVKQKLPNELGIYDMSGNVWEWCQDWYGDYSTDTQINPQGPSSGSVRVIRGGSWMNDANDCRVSRRLDLTPAARTSNLGLRLVLDKHEYVDLGLSVKWATTNVGAESAEDYGDYFAWGETEPKTNYDWSTYKWCDDTENNMTKYNATDGLTTLLPEDDAAHVNWGGEWRMPSDAELTELREYCTWQWTTQNGTAGYIVTGPSGNSIFLPDAGYRITTTHTIGTAYYWTRDLNTTAIQMANGIYFNQDRTGKDKYRRRCGFSVRPVIPTDHCLTIK